ncbi:hypothetical protein K2173_023680 [Erythroxylum novogranatense]|uniref:tRNA-intron lyase n=1 Tax=Erythroxylum novogranatense TaxID=1862640 RepID=A0AAV8TPB5_9ROSI|nr:hypothetical protein K2173_023680 [Erythroxylum novogranatense]
MGPRWKGKGAEAKALADPMSKIVSQLCCSLIQSDACGLLTGCSVLLAIEAEQTELLIRACFGRPIVTSDRDKQCFELGIEEAFYLHFSLKCLRIVGGDNVLIDGAELWQQMKSQRSNFPEFYKAYSHLRTKNWVVRPGSQYGVDFVAYRHHPSLVHSEYAVLVLSESVCGRLTEWSDIYGTVRLCGSVAKTLLVLTVNKNGCDTASPSVLDNYSVEKRIITRWIPERSREKHSSSQSEMKLPSTPALQELQE